MKLKSLAVAAAALAALAFGSGPTLANDFSAAPAQASVANQVAVPNAVTTYETGYVTTQHRGRGNFRGHGRRNNTGRNVAIGVGAAVLGGILLNEAARANSGNNCSRWSYQCNRGSGQSCRNLSRYC